eukprot:g21107.t1
MSTLLRVPLLSVAMWFFTGSALKTAELDYCIGEEMDVDIEACGGGVIPGCNTKYVKIASGYAQCKEILWKHLPDLPEGSYSQGGVLCCEDARQSESTPGDHWKLAPGAQKQVAFKVKAKNDAHLSFFGGKKEQGNRYEIVIGGGGDKFSWIRRCTSNRRLELLCEGLEKVMPRGTHWMLPRGPEKKVVMKVKAKNDAHVGFFTKKKSNQNMYEIVIGGWGDSQSVIRQCNQCKNEVVTKTKEINGDGFEEKEFWATCADDGMLRWGKGNQIGEELMQDADDDRPTALAVMTSFPRTRTSAVKASSEHEFWIMLQEANYRLRIRALQKMRSRSLRDVLSKSFSHWCQDRDVRNTFTQGS